MGVIADLLVKVGADVGSFKTGMAQVNADVAESESRAGKFGNVMAGAGLLAAGAVTGVVAFGLAAVKHSEDAGQAAFQMSEKFGLAKDQASEWLTVARHLGVDADQLGSGFKFLSKNVESMNLQMTAHTVDARTVMESTEKLHLAQDHYNQTLKAFGPTSDKTKAALLSLQQAQDSFNKVTGSTTQKLGPAAQAFGALGLNAFDAKGKIKDANELMLESADVFAKMPDGIEKTGLALKVFGKQGMEMLPVLNLGRQGLEDMMKAGKAQGDVMSVDQVEAAHKLFLEHQKLDAAISGVTNTIGVGLMPMLTGFIGYATDVAAPAVLKFARPIMAELVPAVSSFARWLGTLGPELQTAWGVLSTLAPFIIAIGGAWVLWNAALIITEAVQTGIMAVQFVAGLVAIVSKVGLVTAAQWAWNLAMDANPIGVVVIAIAALVAGVIWAYNNVGWFRDIVNALGGAFMAFVHQFWTDVSPVWDALISFLKQAWDLGGKVAGAIGSIFSSSGTSTAPRGRFSGTRAAGGSIYTGGSYWTGEHGPELITAGADGYVHPAGSGGDMSETNALLRALLRAVTAEPGGQTGTEAALFKAMQGAGMNRLRGMAGA